MKIIAALLIPITVMCQSPDAIKLSEAIGHLIGKNLHSIGMTVDYEALVRGLKEGNEGKEAPLSEEECMLALEAIQQEAVVQLAKKNLSAANEFLINNGQREGVIEIENGKLQALVIQEGSGEVVQSYHVPLVRYEGRTREGQVFSSSLGEEAMALDSVIEGLRRGIEGMHEGEKRTLYIHPDLGFGAEDPSMPNALLIFDVEVIRADASSDEMQASSEQIVG